MKNFSVPGSYILGKTVLLDGLEGGFLTILLSWLYYDSFLAIPFLIPLIWFWHKERENVRREKGQELFRKMFREWILLLASSLTAGYSMENALVQSYQELCLMFPKGGIMQEELKMMLAKAGNNQRPEILFDELAEKYPYEEVQSFAEVFKAARISGGSLQTVIRGTAAQMAEIMDTRREIRTLLAARVYEQRIMSVMPAAVLLYIRLGSGEFLEGLYHNMTGVLVMSVCLGIYGAAYLMGKRMVQFEI